MTRSDFTDKLALKMNIEKKEANRILTAVLDSIMYGLAEDGKKLEIRGFGSFKMRWRKDKLIRNPKTGETIYVPTKYIVRFKPGKDLRELVNKEKGQETTEKRLPAEQMSF